MCPPVPETGCAAAFTRCELGTTRRSTNLTPSTGLRLSALVAMQVLAVGRGRGKDASRYTLAICNTGKQRAHLTLPTLGCGTPGLPRLVGTGLTSSLPDASAMINSSRSCPRFFSWRYLALCFFRRGLWCNSDNLGLFTKQVKVSNTIHSDRRRQMAVSWMLCHG